MSISPEEKIKALENMIVWLAVAVESGAAIGKAVSGLAAAAERNARRVSAIRAGHELP